MTWYELFLWLHVMGAIVWVGGGVMLQAFALRRLPSGEPERMASFAKDAEVVGMRLLTPASFVVLLSGIGVMVDGNWDWDEPFVSWGLLVWVVSALAGAGFLGPESGRVAKAIETGGPASPDAQRRIRRILLYSRLELTLLVTVVFMMVVKLWS